MNDEPETQITQPDGGWLAYGRRANVEAAVAGMDD